MRIRIAGAMLLASGFLLVTPGAAVAATGVILYGGVGVTMRATPTTSALW